jgi:hypothetical protein
MSLGFKTEIGARLGALTTGGTAVITWIDQASGYIRAASLLVTLLVGLATLAYYVPMALSKWHDYFEQRRKAKS